jgi:hypothetical protein
MFGANVFYFLSAPMMELALPFEPFDPKALKQRREIAVHFLGTTLFTDRSAGIRLADRILRAMPMPRVANVQARIENFHARRKML